MSLTASQIDPLVDDEEHARHLEAIKFVDSVFRLEGFEPNECMKAIRMAVLAGVGDYEEAVQEMVAYAKKHKTAKGFVYSKSIGL